MPSIREVLKVRGDNDDEINLSLEAIDSLVSILYRLRLQKKEDVGEYDIYQHALKSVTRFPGCRNQNQSRSK